MFFLHISFRISLKEKLSSAKVLSIIHQIRMAVECDPDAGATGRSCQKLCTFILPPEEKPDIVSIIAFLISINFVHISMIFDDHVYHSVNLYWHLVISIFLSFSFMNAGCK